MPNAEHVEKFTELASQYGPFFFSIVFVLFVPVLGQRWFSKLLVARIQRGDEKKQALKVYRFYWMSGVIAGFVLVFISITWWIYVQLGYVLPDRDAALEARLEQRLAKRVFEGTILGVTDDDMFLDYNFANNGYRLYVYPIENQNPRIIKYVIIFQNDPTKDLTVPFNYMSRATYRALSETKDNPFAPIQIPLCLNADIKSVALVRPPSSPPRFDVQCDAVRK